MGLLYFKETLKYFLRSRLFISKYVKEVELLYGMSPEEIRARNEKRFLEIFRLAYTKSPFYSRLYKEHGIRLDDIQSLQDINKLPVVTKDMFREHPEELLTCAKWKLIKSHTSGTTGTPLDVYMTWPMMWMWQAYLNYYRNRCGFVYGKDAIVSIRGHLNRKTIQQYVPLSKTLFLSSYALSSGNIELYVNRIKEVCPKAMEGYPSSIVSFCNLVQEKNLDVRIPIIFTSSETLQQSQRDFIESTLKGKVFDHYGNTERTIELSENVDHGGYFEVPGYSINEYNGEKGVVTTSLLNDAFPLIRYQVDDVIEMQQDTTSHNISSIRGRSMIYVTGKDGTQFNAAALTYVAKAVPDIIMMQIVQREIGKLDINIIPQDCFTEKSLKEGKKKVLERIGENNMEIKFCVVSEKDLIRTRSGKVPFVVNRCQDK